MICLRWFAVLVLGLGLCASPSAAQRTARASLVFVADDVADAALLRVGVFPDHEVVRLRVDENALDQIGRALADRRGIESVVLVSHGAPGVLRIGSQVVDRAELERRTNDLADWRGSLVSGADILLYGCEVGAGSDGATFVSTLSALTGADVAASIDPTGGTADGDWALERRVGAVTALAPWSDDAMTRWRHRLITVTEPPDLANMVGDALPITLDLGGNTVSGRVATPSDGQDNFQVTVPAGARLGAVSLTLDRSGGFAGSVTFNLSEVRTTSGSFTTGLPLSAGTYYVQVITDFAVGNDWSMSFTVSSTSTTCGNTVIEPGETCDDGNTTDCDGCSPACLATFDGCLVDGTCIEEGGLSPSNACTSCRTAVSRTTYSPSTAGTGCDDTSFCTTDDACDGAGACMGTARDCDDGDDCTSDTCNETTNRCDRSPTPSCVDAASASDGGPPVDAAVRVDGGARDSGAIADTGVRVDGATASDAAVGRDAAVGPGAPRGGCACTAGGASQASGSLLVVLGLALGLRARRRRR